MRQELYYEKQMPNNNFLATTFVAGILDLLSKKKIKDMLYLVALYWQLYSSWEEEGPIHSYQVVVVEAASWEVVQVESLRHAVEVHPVDKEVGSWFSR